MEHCIQIWSDKELRFGIFFQLFSWVFQFFVRRNCYLELLGWSGLAGSLHEGNRLTMMVVRTRNPHLSMSTDRERGIDGWMLSIDWLFAGLLTEQEERGRGGELLIVRAEIRSGMGLCSLSGLRCCLVGVLPNDFYHIILQRK